MKQKSKKIPTKPFKKANDAKWNQVKLEENVFTEDNLTFDGFVNLEVLENYDKRLVKKVRKGRDDINLRALDRLPKNQKKRKSVEVVQQTYDDDIFDQFDETDLPPLKKKKTSDSNNSPDHTPGQFVLLKKQTNKPTKTKKNKKVDEENDTDDDESHPPNLINLQSWQELGVPEEVLKAIVDKGYTSPTEIQTLTIPQAIMGRRDILGAAETGSGKTLAFAIPIIDGILKIRKKESTKSNRLFALILTPTRELASQIQDHIRAVTKYTDIKTAAIFGGLAVVKQKRVLSQHPEIVIATPGRLWELIEEGVEHLKQVNSLKYFVVDETDRMLEKGHFEELQKLLQLLNENKEDVNSRQNFIFSATLTMVHDLPDYVVKRARASGLKAQKFTPGQKLQQLIEAFGVKNPKIVDITSATGTARKLTESRVVCSQHQKDVFLYYFLNKHPGRTIVFCNSIESVRRLVSILNYLNCSPLALHGNMAQRQRLKNIDRFKSSPLGLLVATDVAARGLDIPGVEHVIHYHVPKTTESYVHRSGRTARANNEGLAILIMEPSEVRYYKKLYEDLGRTEDLPLFPTERKPFSMAQERVNLARDLESYGHQEHRQSADVNWADQMAKEAELDSDSSNDSSDNEEERKLQKSKEKRKYREKTLQLAKMLAAPMFMKVTKYPSLNDTVMKQLSAVDTVKKAVEDNKEWKEKQNQNQIKKKKTKEPNDTQKETV